MVAFTSCNDDDSFSYDVPEQAAVTQATLSFSGSEDSQCNGDLNISASDEATIYYMVLSSDSEAPVSTDVFNNGSAVSFSEAGSQNVVVSGLDQNTSYMVYAVTVNNDGLRSEEVFTASYSTSSFSFELGTSYGGTAVFLPNGVTVDGYTVNVTAVDGMANTFDLDATWGPDFIATVCAGCVNSGDYPGPVRIQLDPATSAITVLSGGEPSGQGYVFDVAYVVSGNGSYDICNDVITLNLTDETLFGENVLVVLQ